MNRTEMGDRVLPGQGIDESGIHLALAQIRAFTVDQTGKEPLAYQLLGYRDNRSRGRSEKDVMEANAKEIGEDNDQLQIRRLTTVTEVLATEKTMKKLVQRMSKDGFNQQ